MSTALQVSHVSFAYGTRRALDDVTFSVQPGRFNALLGPNGAGKSTLIALLTRLYELQQGEIALGAHSLRTHPRRALAMTGVVFQQSTLDVDLTVEQNLRYHAALHGMRRADAAQRIQTELERQHLTERRHEPVRALNGGHRRRVEIARALLHQPSLLLLDEPSVGLDPASRHALTAHVRHLCAAHGLTVLWTTHLFDEIATDDPLFILHKGRLVAHGNAAEVAHSGEDLAAMFARLTEAHP